MTFDPNKHHRRSIRLKGYDYSQNGAYFITICTYQKESLFGDVIDKEMILNGYGEVVKNGCESLLDHYPNIILDEYVVMPNHFHGIIIIDNNDVVGAGSSCPDDNADKDKGERTSPLRKHTLGQIIGYFKYQTTKQINLQFNDDQVITLWQRNYHEHVIRDEADLNRIRQYILNNPANWETDENYR